MSAGPPGITPACCKEGKIWTGTPKGKEEEWGGIKVYVTKADSGTRAILMLHDAIGWKAKNVRLLSDAWAACGYTAVVPDLLITGPVPEDAATNQESLGKWFGANPFSDASVLKNIDRIIAELKKEGASKIACEGFCWGGNYALDLAGTDKVAAVAVAHAGGVRPEQLDAVKLPTFFLQAETDPLWTPENLEKAKQVASKTSGCDLKVYPGTQHSFAVRGEMFSFQTGQDTDNPTSSAATAAFHDAKAFFDKHT